MSFSKEACVKERHYNVHFKILGNTGFSLATSPVIFRTKTKRRPWLLGQFQILWTHPGLRTESVCPEDLNSACVCQGSLYKLVCIWPRDWCSLQSKSHLILIRPFKSLNSASSIFKNHWISRKPILMIFFYQENKFKHTKLHLFSLKI